VRSKRAIVAGGSLGGLFAANLLLREGWDVHVYEHSRADLVGRGAGIITHPELFSCLRRIGIAIDERFGVDVPERIALDRQGRTLGLVPIRQCLTTWGRLYELLKSAFPAERYRLGCTLVDVAQTAFAACARFANGETVEADLLVAADGIRSAARRTLLAEVRPRYAGYVAWRGLTDERTIPPAAHEALFPRMGFSLNEREHMVGYPVAGFTRSTRPGERCYNFVWYRPVEESRELADLCTGVDGHVHDMTVPPPLIRPELVAQARREARENLAPQFAEVVERAPQPFFQAIFDLACPRIAFGRIALIGDAAFVARPHVGMGVAKAAGDAMALVDALREAPDVEGALARFEALRKPVGVAVVQHARVLGAYLGGDRGCEARRRHTADAVMREIAITRSFA
jgi:2-polyprenyl-6-methoxyphenol hydroxylase-like FAD-dependent oxidoreductase